MEVLAVAFFLFLALPSSHEADTGCPSSYMLHKDTCYLFDTSIVSWSAARTTCQSTTGGDLVSINSMDEQKFLLQELNNIGTTAFLYLWIGGTYSPTLARWEWLDGTPMTYTNWGIGHPRQNTMYSVIFNPVYYNNFEHHAGRWTGVDAASYPFICEVKKV